MGILTDLIEWFPCDEPAGSNFTGIHAGLNLTQGNSPGSASGKASKARTFVATSSQFGSRADDANFSTGVGVNFTIATWVKLTGLGGNQAIACKRSSGTVREWHLYYTGGPILFRYF